MPHFLQEVLDLTDDGNLEWVGFNLWRMAGHRWGWLNRLRYIWWIIRHGHPYTDDVLLSPEKARELWDQLTRMLEVKHG